MTFSSHLFSSLGDLGTSESQKIESHQGESQSSAVGMLNHTTDYYDGVNIDESSLPKDVGEFKTAIQASLKEWKTLGKKGVWLKVRARYSMSYNLLECTSRFEDSATMDSRRSIRIASYCSFVCSKLNDFLVYKASGSSRTS